MVKNCQQQGTILAMTLIVLLIVTALIIHLFERNIIGIKMSNTFKLKTIAFEKAELCLKNAEQYIRDHQPMQGWQFQSGCFTIEKEHSCICYSELYKILAFGKEGSIFVKLQSGYRFGDNVDLPCLAKARINLGRQYWRELN